MVSFFGDYNTSETVDIPFNTFDSNDPTASVTITNLVAGDIDIHKDGGVTQRSSAAGVTVSINFDGITGNHMIHIDLSDNTDAGFYADGARYQVRIEGVTVDGGTLNSWVGAFSVGCTLRPTTAGRTLDIQATGEVDSNMTMILGHLLTNTGTQIADAFQTMFDVASPVLLASVAMKGTDSAALASVVGTLADGAAAGDPTAADTLMQYIKQLINILVGTVGIPSFPAESAPGNNVSLAEVIRAIHADVTGLNGDVMVGTNGANTTVPDAAGTAAALHTISDALIGSPTDTDIATDIVNLQTGIDTIQTVGAAINEPVVASPGGFVLTTGINEVNTEDVTPALDGITHDWESTGNAMDGRYLLNIGGAYVPVSVSLHGKLSGAGGDAVLIRVNSGTIAAPVWATRGNITRTAPATLLTHSFILFPGDIMTGVDAGKVQIQIVNDGVVTAATMIVDQLYVSKSLSASTTGYANGSLWLDTINGVAGTVENVNGTADNPVDTIADINTLSAVTGIKRVYVTSGSSVTFAASQEGYQFDGCNWTLALGGQSISGTSINCANVTGIATGAVTPKFYDCHLGNVTIPPSHLDLCGLEGTLTFGSAGTFFFDTCHSGVAGTSSPVLDFGGALNSSNINFRRYSGGLEIQNMGAGSGTYNMSLEGHGQLIINANCSATSTVAIRGHFTVTDNASGAVTLSNEAMFDHNTIIDDILTDTGTTIPATLAGLNDISTAQVNTECDTALTDYDGPTRAEATSDKDEVIVQVNANETKIDILDTNLDAVLVDTGTTIPASIAALNDISVANILAGVVEGTVTVEQALRLALSVLTGKSSGGGTTTLVFRDIGDTKNRISATVDANGNRTAVGTRDGT